MEQVTPKFSPTRSAELLALAEKSASDDPCYNIYDDPDFIASAPDLATELRIAVEVIKRVLPYAAHLNGPDKMCKVLVHSENACDCGLSEALSMVGE